MLQLSVSFKGVNTSLGPDTGVTSRSVKESNAALERMRHSCSCTAHPVACIYANTTTRQLFTCTAMFIDPTKAQHGLAMEASRNPGMSMAWRISCAKGEWAQELRDMLSSCENATHLLRAGFLTCDMADRATPERLEQDRSVARRGHAFLAHLLGRRVEYCSACELSLPWKAAALLDDSDEVKRETLEKFRSWLDALVRLCREATVDPDAARFRMRLVWPDWDWAVELLLTLAEYDFKEAIPPHHRKPFNFTYERFIVIA